MTDLYDPTLFTRHNRPLHSLWLDSQAWFCARDLGRLIGRYLDEHIVRKLDPDQHRILSLLRYGKYSETVMISESGAYTVLAHHYIPENRSLRRWLTHEVIPALRNEYADDVHTPSASMLRCAGSSLKLMHWEDEPWVRLRDFPDVLMNPTAMRSERATHSGSPWRAITSRLFRR